MQRRGSREGSEMVEMAGIALQTRSIARGLVTAEEETAPWGFCDAGDGG